MLTFPRVRRTAAFDRTKPAHVERIHRPVGTEQDPVLLDHETSVDRTGRMVPCSFIICSAASASVRSSRRRPRSSARRTSAALRCDPRVVVDDDGRGEHRVPAPFLAHEDGPGAGVPAAGREVPPCFGWIEERDELAAARPQKRYGPTRAKEEARPRVPRPPAACDGSDPAAKTARRMPGRLVDRGPSPPTESRGARSRSPARRTRPCRACRDRRTTASAWPRPATASWSRRAPR